MPHRYLITGATGFVGGHVAVACADRGAAVAAIARPQSDTSLLEQRGVRIVRGELTDERVLQTALQDVDVVVHCAARVGDEGPVDEYQAVNVEGLRRLLDACRGRPLHRFVHMSTLGVYEPRNHHGTDESEPLPATHLDGYTQSKVEAERLALEYQRKEGIPVVVLRPGFVYGPRDRTVMPRLLQRLAEGKFHYLGAGPLRLNCIYVGNLVEAVFLAVDQPGAVGQVYNLTDGEPVTKQRFIEAIVQPMGYPAPHQRLPLWLAGLLRRLLWRRIRRAAARGSRTWLTVAQFKFLMLNLDFSIDKARRELGYRPRYSFEEGMRETIAWYKQNA